MTETSRVAAGRLSMVAVFVAALVGSGIGCSGATTIDGAGGGGDGVVGAGGSGGQEVTHSSLFECGAPVNCAIYDHLGPELEASTCAGKLVASGAPGVVTHLLDPGPYINQVDTFYLLMGNGTVVVQSRERHCDGTEPEPCPDPLPWEAASSHELCHVVFSARQEAACANDDDPDCTWTGQVESCEPIEDMTCEQLEAVLQQE